MTLAHTSFCVLRVCDVTLQCSRADHFHYINSCPGKWHAIATQPLAETIRLVPQLLNFVLVLTIKT